MIDKDLSISNLDYKRRSLLFRASHRGILEMDIILKNYTFYRIFSLLENELNDLENIISYNDLDILEWIQNKKNPPPTINLNLLNDIKYFVKKKIKIII